MTTNELACQQLVELLSEHLDGTLPEAERERMVEHLGDCDGCTSALEQMRATIRVAGSLTEDRVAEAERERVREAFRGWQREAER